MTAPLMRVATVTKTLFAFTPLFGFVGQNTLPVVMAVLGAVLKGWAAARNRNGVAFGVHPATTAHAGFGHANISRRAKVNDRFTHRPLLRY